MDCIPSEPRHIVTTPAVAARSDNPSGVEEEARGAAPLLRTAERGQGANCPKASSSKGSHNTQCFKVWGPCKVNQKYFAKLTSRS